MRKSDGCFRTPPMAKQKRKAGKSPAPAKAGMQVPLAPIAAQSEWLLPALGALALVGAWLAALGGVADGTFNLDHLVNTDTVRPYLMFRELFVEGVSLSGWRQGVAPFYFPDFALLWAMFALGMGPTPALLLFPLAQTALAAAGWILVCDALFEKSAVRRFAVLALHALGFFALAWRGGDIHYPLMSGLWHYGAWAAVPWLAWLSLRALRVRSSGNLAALAVLLAAAVASDMLIVPWFVAPSALCAAVLVLRGALSRRACFLFFAALAVGIIAGRLLFYLGPGVKWGSIALNPGDFARSIRLTAANFAATAVHNPAEALVWAAFVFIAFRRGAAALKERVRKNQPPSAVFRESARIAAALFVPAAMLAALAAPIVTGTVHDATSLVGRMGVSNRYSHPLLLFPLFIGWALMPWKKIAHARLVAAGSFAALALAAAPKLAKVEYAALDLYQTPFNQCVVENARRLGWSGGVSSPFFAPLMLSNSSADLRRMLPVVAFRRPGEGQSAIAVDSIASNARRFNGEFQFVVANFYNGRIAATLPNPHRPGKPAAEMKAEEAHYFIDPDSVRRAFGEPKEVIDCAGVGLLHYDPPLTFDFSHLDDPYLAPVARW